MKRRHLRFYRRRQVAAGRKGTLREFEKEQNNGDTTDGRPKEDYQNTYPQSSALRNFTADYVPNDIHIEIEVLI